MPEIPFIYYLVNHHPTLFCSAPKKLLFTANLVKDMLDKAFRCTDTDDLLDQISEIMAIQLSYIS